MRDNFPDLTEKASLFSWRDNILLASSIHSAFHPTFRDYVESASHLPFLAASIDAEVQEAFPTTDTGH